LFFLSKKKIKFKTKICPSKSKLIANRNIV
jgi:hypothetical protein